MKSRSNASRMYMLLVIAVAVPVTLYAAATLRTEKIDLQFLVLALFTIAISSRLTVRIPRVSGHISVSDTFLFLTILLYGGSAAILLAIGETLCSALRFSRKQIHISPLTIVFNCAMMACSTFLTCAVVELVFGDPTALRH